MSVFSVSAAGMNQAMARFAQASEALTRAVSGGADDAGRAIAAQIEAKAAFKANIAVVRAQDEMLGELLDIRA